MSDILEKLVDEVARLRREHDESQAALRRELAEVREQLAYREQVLVGWKEIAAYVGYSEDHCKELGLPNQDDPIPHWLQGKMVAAYRTALDAWLFRRKQPAQRRITRPEKPGPTERQLGMFDAPKVAKRGRATDGSAS